MRFLTLPRNSFVPPWFFPEQLWSWMGFSILPRNSLCSIMIFWLRVGFWGLSPYSFGILFHHHFLVPSGLGFWGLSPESFGILFHHHFLVPSGYGYGSGVCLPSLLAFFSIIISCFLLVPARVPEFVSLLFSLFLCPERDSVPSWSPGSLWFWLGFRGLSTCFSFLSFLRKRIRALSPFFFLRNGATNEFFIAHERRGNMICCCLGSMLV